MSFFKHAHEHLGTKDAGPVGGKLANAHRPTTDIVDTSAREHAVPRHTGYASTDLGMTRSAATGGPHSGYAPTDAPGPRTPRSPSGGPGGMAGGGMFHSQGGGHHENGLHHSGWGPADTRFNDPRSASVDHHDDDPASADTGKSVGH